MTLPEVGLHHVDYATYDSWLAERYSRLRLMLRSPLHYQANADESTNDMRTSRALHTAILEPDQFESEFIIKPEEYDGRKAEWKAWKENEAAGREILDADFHDVVEGISVNLALHPAADAIMQSERKHTECSLHWIEPNTSEPMKVRLDALAMYEGQGCIVNFKFVRFAARHSFTQLLAKLTYHMQAAISLDGANTIAPAQRRYVWIVCEKSPPYAVAVYEPSEMMLSVGRSLYIDCIKRVQQCRKTDTWPTYNDDIEPLDLPRWAEEPMTYEQHDDEIEERSYANDALGAAFAIPNDRD